MNMTLEVIPVPVSDTDRAIAFYKQVGFKVDMDQRMGDDVRFVQLTPPGSSCSIHLGEGMSTLKPGTLKGLILVVESADAAKAELDKRGVETSDVESQPWVSMYISPILMATPGRCKSRMPGTRAATLPVSRWS